MIAKILGVLALLGIFFGSYQYLDTRFAKAGDVRAIEQRLDYKIMGDQLNEKQKRTYVIEDRYKNSKMPETVKEEYQQLQEEKVELKEKMKALEKK